MKRTLIAALGALGFLLITGGVIVEDRPHPVLFNSKPFSKAFLINGVWAIPMEDVIKGAGGNAANFKYQGTTFEAVSSVNAAAGRQFFRVNRPGIISTHVLVQDGKRFIPVADLVKALNGGVFNQGTLTRGESINLNFTVNGDGILGAQQ
jgi:hypothetical protein